MEQKQKISKANKGKEGPNKIYINKEKLYYEYIILNKPKKEILKIFNIGMGLFNRILSEYKFYKTKKLLLKTN